MNDIIQKIIGPIKSLFGRRESEEPDSNRENEEEGQPSGSSVSSEEGQTEETSDGSQGFVEKISGSVSSLLRDLTPNPLGAGQVGDENEQPTNYNPVFVAAIMALLTLALTFVYFYPSSSGDGSGQQQTAGNNQDIEARESTPGTEGEDPARFFEGGGEGNQGRRYPPGEGPPGEGGPGGATAQTGQPTGPANQQGNEPGSQEGGAVTDASEFPSPSEYQERYAGSGPPGSAPGSAVPSNPYESSSQRGSSSPPGAAGNGGNGQNNPELQKSLEAPVSIETEPPGNFDPAEEGIPRDPASGRPIGSPPTPTETRKEQEYREERRQDTPGQSGEEDTNPRQEIREEYPTGDLSEEEEFLARQEARSATDESVTEVQGPFSPYVIPRGTVIPIVLETKANNQVPGATVMRVTRDVYDRTYRHILIPRGSEVVSSYSTSTEVGQNRVLVSANRLNLPDGRYVEFSDVRAAGPQGTAGLEDQVDRHLLSRFGAAGGLAVLGAVINASNPLSFLGLAQQDSSGVVAGGGVAGAGQGNFGQRIGTSLSQQVNQIIGQLLEKQVDREATLTLRPGLKGLLVINEDIDLKRPYYEPGGDFKQQDDQFRKYKLKRTQRQMKRTLRQIQEMTQNRERARELRNQAREEMQDSRRRSSVGPTSSRSPVQANPKQEPKFYIDRLRQQGRRMGTFLPPRRGPTSRERFVYGQNYRREPNPIPEPSGQRRFQRSDNLRPRGQGRSRSSRRGLRPENVPDQLQTIRNAKRRANPEQFREPNRPLYDEGMRDPRFTRGKENFRPDSQGELSEEAPSNQNMRRRRSQGRSGDDISNQRGSNDR